MEEIYEKIMREGYGLQLRHGTRTRTGLVCRTDRGLRELKKPRGSTDSLRLAFDVKKRLRENGFANISRCYPTLEGEPFYRQDGTLYILEDVLPQGTLAEDCAETFLQGAETLGEMHAAAKGLASEAAHWEKNRLPQLYAKRRSELAKVRRRNDKRGSYDAIDLLLLQYYEPYMERAAEAEELLNALPDLTVEANANWNKRYQENLMRLKRGDLYQVARVIKSLMQRDSLRGLSTGERKTLHNAKQITISEIVMAEKVAYREVETRIDHAMMQLPVPQ